MQRVRGVALVEDNFAAVERASPRDRQDLLQLVARNVVQKTPLHGPTIRDLAVNVTGERTVRFPTRVA
jgi:hypothetical protein